MPVEIEFKIENIADFTIDTMGVEHYKHTVWDHPM